MVPIAFDRSRLSSREAAVFEAAIEGLTDQQIAFRLDLSVSTVNSYWVRIRGKLGQHSRTELVALALKQVARDAQDAANAELAELRASALTHARVSEDYERADIFRAALDAMPEAVLVACQTGIIRYANARLETMFGYSEGELTDQPVSLLLPKAIRGEEERRIQAYMKDPTPMRLGVSRVLYGQDKNGFQFRVVILLDGRPTSAGPVVSCIVRDFTSEIDTRRGFNSAN